MSKSSPQTDSEALVAEFQAAITNLATMYTAQHAAAQSETDTIQTLESMGIGNGVYVTPNDIPDHVKDQLTQSSLDAHLKKVQSEQITTTALQQVSEREAIAKRAYLGKKITFHLEDASFQPFESVWTDKKTGQFKTSVINNRRVSGTIDDLSFEHNLIVLKPLWFSRLFTPGRKYFLVHVINTTTILPAISAI